MKEQKIENNLFGGTLFPDFRAFFAQKDKLLFISVYQFDFDWFWVLICGSQEAILLNDYGKVMYFKVEFGSSATPNIYTDTFYVLALEVEDVQTPDWDNTFLTDTPFGGDLYYSTTGSQELVVDLSSLPNDLFKSSGDEILLSSFGEDVTITTWYDGPGIGNFVWLWINN